MPSDDAIVRKMVSDIAEKNVQFMNDDAQRRQLDNLRRIVPVLLEKGVDSLNLSMFDQATKIKL